MNKKDSEYKRNKVNDNDKVSDYIYNFDQGETFDIVDEESLSRTGVNNDYYKGVNDRQIMAKRMYYKVNRARIGLAVSKKGE